MHRLFFTLIFAGTFVLSSLGQAHHLVISQVYGGGGNAGALFKNDFVELFNPTGAAVELSGWSLQYAAATGRSWAANSVALSGSIAPGGYYLIQLSSDGATGSDLPAPDLVSDEMVLSATGGKLALVQGTAALAGNCPDAALVVDFLGYGAADCKEGQPAPSPAPARGLQRINNGCTDLGNNYYDFAVVAPSPRNSAATSHPCNGSYIVVSDISPKPFCVDEARGAAGAVRFSASGTFSRSLFTVLLSDAAGSFTHATVVGELEVSGTDPFGTLSINIPAGTASGETYHLRIDATGPSLTGIQSSAVEIINGAKNISAFSASPNTGEMTLRWNNPAGCFDEVLIVEGAGTSPGSGKVVFKGTSGPVTITGLTDGNAYTFTAYTRRGTAWSSGISLTGTPRLMPRPGEILINQLSPGYDSATHEYIELVNTTGKTFDLSELAIRYAAGSGRAGVAGGTLGGTLPPYAFWLLSPKPSVTVGKTGGLVPDGFFEDGFAAGSGQVALVRKTDNTLLDAVAYGSIGDGDFCEGSPASGPPARGGLKRAVDGVDRNTNSTDFVSIENTAVDLRNSRSRLLPEGTSFPGGSYARLYVTGNASLSGNTDLSEKAVLGTGRLSLGNFHLSATSLEGGSDSAYIRTDGTGLLTLKSIGTDPQTAAVGNRTYNPVTISNGGGLDWSVAVADSGRAGGMGKAVARTWTITPSAAPAAGADLVFGYNDGDASQVDSSFQPGEPVVVWNFHGGKWQMAGGAVTPSGAPGGHRTVTLTNRTLFSPFSLTNVLAPLPVLFSRLSAVVREGGPELRWTNFSEAEVVAYTLQRSFGGQHFSDLAVVMPIKNDGGKADYIYNDVAAPAGAVAYRVKAVEQNGKETFTGIASVTVPRAAPVLQLAPNPAPAGGGLYLRVADLPAGRYRLLVYNAGGATVYSAWLPHAGGPWQQHLQWPLAAGRYFLELSGKQCLSGILEVR
ncbi:lamin tail domain-containing protein [Paraflavisolibacter sp. H34]|uniref:lamin tail domain-containing protein n=1 Tax=Huijunlia imazamoxiresistens TaxID=3127457 RepID=UPI0030182EBC